MLHNFSATAYEIADFNYKNLRELNIIKEKNYVNTISDSFFTVSLVDETKTNYNYNNLGNVYYKLEFSQYAAQCFGVLHQTMDKNMWKMTQEPLCH